MIPLTPIEGSSQIAAAGHDPATGTLAVRFHTGTVYQYQDVPAEVAEGLLSAQSKGRYFGAEIRGKFEYSKVVPEEGAADATA